MYFSFSIIQYFHPHAPKINRLIRKSEGQSYPPAFQSFPIFIRMADIRQEFIAGRDEKFAACIPRRVQMRRLRSDANNWRGACPLTYLAQKASENSWLFSNLWGNQRCGVSTSNCQGKDNFLKPITLTENLIEN